MKDDEKITRLELTAKFLDSLKATDKEQRYTDAKTPGLTIAVKPASANKAEGSKLWRLRYTVNGVAKMISLGQYPLVGLREARDKAFLIRKDLENGIDPVQKKKAAKHSVEGKTFKEVAEKWIASRAKDKWAESHATRNEQRLKGNIYPVLGDKDLNALTLEDFENALQPVVDRGALETAQRICALCIEILQYAARFKYLANRGIIYDLQQFKKDDLQPKRCLRQSSRATGDVAKASRPIGLSEETASGGNIMMFVMSDELSQMSTDQKCDRLFEILYDLHSMAYMVRLNSDYYEKQEDLEGRLEILEATVRALNSRQNAIDKCVETPSETWADILEQGIKEKSFTRKQLEFLLFLCWRSTGEWAVDPSEHQARYANAFLNGYQRKNTTPAGFFGRLKKLFRLRKQ
ncbi:MAG: hypothetical protein DELT_02213 [Desulfovibrio sp.]